jgi:hypothetical protein
MAGKYGSASVTVAYDGSAGGSPVTVTSFVISMGGAKITSKMQDSTAYGDTIMKQLPTGLKELPDWEMEGWWDTTASTGTHATFLAPDIDPNVANARTLTIVFGDSKTWATEGFLKEYEVLAQVGNLTKFKAKGSQHSGGWS